ncbi:unnamed protein product [Macrosiphum euphorbiae]|uniref:Uncharacterized protein n=1 Tax=Macrosiphum euphorbiae TaxID=13131 RepID=A0AAV0WTZ0_9HEMI|nr:unnamed protein product [Macrosiphum euphorbiae]
MADNKRKKLKNCSKRHIRRINNEFCRRLDDGYYSDNTNEDDIIRAPEIQSTIVRASTSSNAEPKINNENSGKNLQIFSSSCNNSAQNDGNEYFSSSSNNFSYCSSPISNSCNSYDSSNINLVEINNVDRSLIENNKDDNTVTDDCSNLDLNCSLLEEQLREWHFNHNTTLASLSSMLKIW